MLRRCLVFLESLAIQLCRRELSVAAEALQVSVLLFKALQPFRPSRLSYPFPQFQGPLISLVSAFSQSPRCIALETLPL